MVATGKKNRIASPNPNGLLPGEDADIRKDVDDLVADPEKWLDEPNTRLGGEKPRELIGTDREQILRDLLRGIKYGLPT